MTRTKSVLYLFTMLNIICFLILVYYITDSERSTNSLNRKAILVNNSQYECLVDWKKKEFVKNTIYGATPFLGNHIIFVDDIDSLADFNVKYSGCFVDIQSYASSFEQLGVVYRRIQKNGAKNISIYKPFDSEKIFVYGK